MLYKNFIFLFHLATGILVSNHHLLIADGYKPAKGAYPFMAGIYDMMSLRVFCGGVIIAPDWILTAAHCLYKNVNGSQVKIDLKHTFVRLGGHRVIPKVDPTQQDHYILEAFVPNNTKQTQVPGLNYTFLSNDIALLKLKESIVYGPGVDQIVLIKDDTMIRESDMKGIAAGWGHIDSDRTRAPTLQAVELHLIWDTAKCKTKATDETHFCGFAHSGGVCKGDSGGPLFVNYYNQRRTSTKVLIGVIGRGQGNCEYGPEKRGHFTDVSKNCDWIQTKTEINGLCVDLASLGDGKSPLVSMDPVMTHKTVFCTFCPSLLEWIQDLFSKEPESRTWANVKIVAKLNKDCQPLDQLYRQGRQGPHCIVSLAQIVDEKLEEIKNYQGSKEKACQEWFEEQECYYL